MMIEYISKINFITVFLFHQCFGAEADECNKGIIKTVYFRSWAMHYNVTASKLSIFIIANPFSKWVILYGMKV